jgi:hypothetical protein
VTFIQVFTHPRKLSSLARKYVSFLHSELKIKI